MRVVLSSGSHESEHHQNHNKQICFSLSLARRACVWTAGEKQVGANLASGLEKDAMRTPTLIYLQTAARLVGV